MKVHTHFCFLVGGASAGDGEAADRIAGCLLGLMFAAVKELKAELQKLLSFW